VPTYQLLPGATGVDFPGSARLHADRRGRINVTDEQAAAIHGSAAKRRYDALLEVAPMRPSARRGDLVCPCGFAPWAYQKSCPRCGSIF
jgi:hypothetical protein